MTGSSATFRPPKGQLTGRFGQRCSGQLTTAFSHSVIHSTRSRGTLADMLLDLPPVDLGQVLAAVSLQTRLDTKYLLTPEQFASLAAVLRNRFQVLEIDGRRMFGYESLYFDSADLALFHAHRQGRRRRFKVRTRTYLDSKECMFEVKLKGHRGQTIKHRLPYAAADRSTITPQAQAFLDDLLREEHTTAPRLEPALITSYGRSTLVDLAGGARLTCDVDLVCRNNKQLVHGPDRILVESKSTGSASPADKALAASGVRPIRISKYCVAVALLHPQLSANPWHRTLTREFDWQRHYPGPRATPLAATHSAGVH